jgi:menaquinone-9 beta-reductase
MTHAVVVGGGPAGAAVATLLARSGRRVVLVERDAGPSDKVCGEFLSREAATYLADLGVDLAALGAVPIAAVRLAHERRTTRALLPFPAWSLSRRALDEALVSRATAEGATVIRGVKVTALVEARGRVRADLADGRSIEADHAFLATGKHDLRDHRRPAGSQDDLVAFKLHLRPSREAAIALEGHVELALFSNGYAGLSPIEGDRVNLCLVVRRRRFAELGRRWERLLGAIRSESPHLAERLEGAEPVSPRPLALAAIPYGHVERRSSGLFVLGDQAAVIPSFTGDGLSIALHSACLAAKIHLAAGTAHAFQRRLAHDVTRPVILATLLSHALVRGAGQRALALLARVAPGLVAAVATATRIPRSAIARARPHARG